jgi:ribosomal protein S18 acetylase RimI-like enzyme
MSNITIRPAEMADVEQLNTALRELSNDLDDSHHASDESLKQAGFGQYPCFSALLAECQNEVIAVAMFSPLYSTTRGAPGVFVSDLWVSKSRRGAGLARNLLAAVCDAASDKWCAAFLRLNVYRHNQSAIAAYEKIGFDADLHESVMTLNLGEFISLKAKY